MTNLDRYKNDLKTLLKKGKKLNIAMLTKVFPSTSKFENELKKVYGDKADEILKCVIRSKASTDSGASRPLNLEHVVH